MEQKIIPTNKSYTDYLYNQSQHSLFLSPTTPDEITKLILQLDTNKATGPNSIPTKILKLLANIINIPLSNLINISFSSGIC